MHDLSDRDSLPNYVSYKQYPTQCAHHKLHRHTEASTTTAATAVQYNKHGFCGRQTIAIVM